MKCSITSETLTGFHPPPLWLPRCDNPERKYVIIAKRRGGRGGQALSPPSSNQYFVVHIIAKGILQSHYFTHFFLVIQSIGLNATAFSILWHVIVTMCKVMFSISWK